VITSCAAAAAFAKRESGQSTGQLFGDSCWPGQASLLIPTVLPLARVARLALGAVSFERISIAEAADATDRLLALLEGIEPTIRSTRTTAVLRTPGRCLRAQAGQS
jgi:hypothetical protein